jgi:hypothetical protein
MRRFRRWLRNFALSLTGVGDLLKRAGDVVRESRERPPSDADNAMAMELQLQLSNLRGRMNEMLDLRRAEVACYKPDMPGLRESAAIQTVAQFKETLWELELALEDRGWVRETALAQLEFSRYGVGRLITHIRIASIKNPLIKRGAEICKLYVFGRGVEIRCEDDSGNDVVQAFLDANKSETSHIALAEKETSIQTDGSLYFGLPTDGKGNVAVKMIEPLEIMDVVTEADDSSKILYYMRQWSQMDLDPKTGIQTPKQVKAAYPSLELVNSGVQILPQIGTYPVNAEMPIYRVRAGSSPPKWRWAVPPLYASVDWARAYKDFLEDWATIQRALARFALMVETKGGPAAIASYQALLSTTFGDSGGTTIERNPPPTRGAAHIGGDQTKITPFKSAGSTDSPEQARRLLLMNASAQGMPETFYGDASTGSLATAQSLDRPTELKFREMQQRWIETITCILAYVLDVSKTTPGGRLKEARASNPAPQPLTIVVKFPSVLEHDVQTMVQAWAEVAAMGGRTGIPAGIVDRRTIADGMLAEMGYENRGKLLEEIYGKKYDAADDVTDQRSQVPPQLLAAATGKPLTDLSTPPPLPPPPPPPAPPVPHPAEPLPPHPAAVPVTPPAKPATAAVPAAKESLLTALERLTEAVGTMGGRNGRH